MKLYFNVKLASVLADYGIGKTEEITNDMPTQYLLLPNNVIITLLIMSATISNVIYRIVYPSGVAWDPHFRGRGHWIYGGGGTCRTRKFECEGDRERMREVHQESSFCVLPLLTFTLFVALSFSYLFYLSPLGWRGRVSTVPPPPSPLTTLLATLAILRKTSRSACYYSTSSEFNSVSI